VSRLLNTIPKCTSVYYRQTQPKNVASISIRFSKPQLPLPPAEVNKDIHLLKWGLLIPTKCGTFHMFPGKVESYNMWILNIAVNIYDIKYLTTSIKYSTRLGLYRRPIGHWECKRVLLWLGALDQMWTYVNALAILGITDQDYSNFS